MMHHYHRLKDLPVWGRVVFVVALAAVVLGLIISAAQQPQTDETWEGVLERGALRVGMDASYPPFEVVDANGDFFGYDVDLARSLGERWGVEVQFVNVSFDGLYDALLADRFDIIISALPYDQTRTQDVSYTQSYFNAGEVLLVREGGGIASVDDLNGNCVAVELGSEGHQQILLQVRNKGLELEIMTLQSSDELVLACADSGVDAIACDRVKALELLSTCSGWYVVESLTEEPYVIAVLPEAATLLEETDIALEAWLADGFVDELAGKWFSTGG